MERVYIAPPGYTMDSPNPFTPGGDYDRSWTIVIVDQRVRGTLFQQCSAFGCYVVSMSPDYVYFHELIADFIQYETDSGRKIILVAEQGMNLHFTTYYKDAAVRQSDPRFLIHSTTLARYKRIASDGMLKSPSRLERECVHVHSVGLMPLGEPKDYLDYVMFSAGGVAPELVVNSHLCGQVSYNPLSPYTPQARLYFDGHKLVRDGFIVRNVASMVYDSVPLRDNLLKTVTAEDLSLPNGDTYWTPQTFSECADALMSSFFYQS